MWLAVNLCKIRYPRYNLAGKSNSKFYSKCFLRGPLRWLMEQKKPKFPRSLQNSQRDTTNLAITFQTWSFELPLINTLYLSHSWEKHTLDFPEIFWKIQTRVHWSEKELIISECFHSALFRGSSSWTVKWWRQRSVSVFCRAVHPPCNGFFCKGEVPFTNCIMHRKCLRWNYFLRWLRN